MYVYKECIPMYICNLCIHIYTRKTQSNLTFVTGDLLCTAQYISIQYITVQYSPVLYCIVLYITVQYNTNPRLVSPLVPYEFSLHYLYKTCPCHCTLV